METFSCNTKIIAGIGAIWELGQYACRRLLLVADPYFQKSDVPEKIKKAIKAEEWACFYEVSADPSVELAAKGTAFLQAFGPDTVVALGGGSAMDCAKAMVYFSGEALPLIAIPTTSGSGSEVTDFAVLTHQGAKHPLVDAKLKPVLAVLDGNLLNTLPKGLVADAGFDVIAHAMESYVATNAGAVSRALARDAFATAYTHLPASYGGDTSVRQRVHLAATMAGVAFSQSGLGLCHAMAHALGGQFHIPHGRLNAILLPGVMEANKGANALYADLARGAGLGGTAELTAVRNLKNALHSLRKALDLPENLAKAGVSPQKLREKTPELVKTILADPCCATNPVRPTEDMVRAVLQQVAGRG